MPIEDFATLSLAGSGLSREPWVKPRYRRDDHDARFDSDTLWLDAIHQPGSVRLICPRLNNLWPVMRRARFTLDGCPVRPRFRHYPRHTEATLPCDSRPGRVAVRLGDWTGETRVHPQAPDLFTGRDTLITLSKDNALDWITDFTRFHVHHHGLQAMLFVDNGSRDYGRADIAAAIRRGGVAHARVLRTPLPLGPLGRKPFVNSELFLQTGILNACRLRFLGRAAAVLNVDVDELVMSPGTTIFDLARGSRAGFVRFPGRWRHVAAERDGQPRHADHVWSSPKDRPCPDKWCILPSGPLGRWQWRPHTLERLPLDRVFRERGKWFYHCRQISTGWKSAGRLSARAAEHRDPVCARALEDAGLAATTPLSGTATTS